MILEVKIKLDITDYLNDTNCTVPGAIEEVKEVLNEACSDVGCADDIIVND